MYVRVSTDMDSQKSSIAHQKSFFEKYIRDKGLELYKVYQDIESGISIERRSGLKRLIEDSDKGLFSIILTKSISRFARNTLEGLQYIREFKKKNIRFITIEDSFDSEEYDEFMFTLLLSMAQKESEKISERIRFGKYERAQKGYYNGSNPPYGYSKIGKDRLKPAGDITTEIVNLIFQMYIDGNGLYKIANHLNTKEYPTPSQTLGKSNSGDLWHQSTIRNILTNEVYIGNMVQNKTKTKDFLKGIRVENPKEEYIKIKATHEGIISDFVFEEAQSILKERKVNKSGNNIHFFTNILYCGECGSSMHYKKNKGAYICGRLNKMGKKYCKGSYINEEKLKDVLREDFIKRIKEEVDLARLNTKIKEGIDKRYKNKGQKEIEGQIKDIQRKEKRLLDIFIGGFIDEKEYTMKKKSIISQLELLQSKKNRLKLKNDDYKEQTMDSFDKLLEFLGFDDTVISKLVAKIQVNNKKHIKIYYNFSH